VRILADAAEGEPTEPSKPGFVGFEGTPSAESPEIGAGSDPAELARASAVLNRPGVRIVPLEGDVIVRVWSDLDGRKFGPRFTPSDWTGYAPTGGHGQREGGRQASGEP
jgi:hypothetical protein